MIELNSKKWYIENTEKLIDELKRENLTFDAISAIKAIADSRSRTDSQLRIYCWLLNALSNETQREEVEKFSFEEASQAYYFFHAIYDCVTMVI